MQFVKVNDDVASVELSVDTLYVIGNALDLFVDVRRDSDVSVDRELALATGFNNAYLAFRGDQSVPTEPETTESE